MKLKNAPNLKKQSADVFEVRIIAGSQAWDFAKMLPKPRTADEMAFDEVLPTGGSNPPIILPDDVLENIAQYRIIPEKSGAVTIQRANFGKNFSNTLLNLICLNIAKQSKATVVRLIDEAENHLEDLSNYIERIRKGETMAEEIAQAETKPLDLNSDKPKQKEIVEAFLQWHKAPLKRDVMSGRTYQYNGIMWEALNDEQLKRDCMAFYDAFNGDYTANKISKLAELITLRIDPIPLENPDYIGLKNGVLNKKTGEFLQHSPEHYLRFIDNFDCNQDLAIPAFEDWLDFVSNGNPNKMQAILAGLFMILTNWHEWGLFIEATGTAGAGKSIFGEIATILNGRGNTAIIDLKGFEDDKSRSALIGKTLAYSPDQKPYKGTADDLKAMTGGDQLTVKLLYKDEIKIKVNAVFMMSTNYPILFTDRNGGIARRRVIIPFDRPIPKEKKDVKFADKIKAELYGIVNALLDYFPEPETARLILESYQEQGEAISIKQQSNHLIDFAQAFKLEPIARGLPWGSNYGKKDHRTALYKAYLHYCACQNLKNELNLQSFKQALPDALKEAGQKGNLIEATKDGYKVTNIYWKDRDQTIKEWEG